MSSENASRLVKKNDLIPILIALFRRSGVWEELLWFRTMNQANLRAFRQLFFLIEEIFQVLKDQWAALRWQVFLDAVLVDVVQGYP